MQYLSLPMALALSLAAGVTGAVVALPDATLGPAVHSVSEQCRAYRVLHANLSSLDETERFGENIDACIKALSRR